MNLQPLLDLKERLENAAVAGVGLLGEDFRLKRAAEGIKPLAAASPVFGKIDQGLQGLLSSPPEERGGRLLDTLALVDAVLYTQGGSGAEGELAPLEQKKGVYRELSYNQLHPLLEALTGTGGGRMNPIQDAWENHREYFSDYRVLPQVIAGLGESYAELAELNGEILKAQGPEIIPWLKEGFDPAGKREMARRVQIIEELAGAGENGWYLEQLSQAKREVREALIFALRHEPANAEKLMELCQTEKKDCQAAAHWALARCDIGDALGYLRQLAKKDQDQVLRYLQHSRTRWAAQLAGELFCENMADFRQNPNIQPDQKTWDRLSLLLLALEGKTGPEIREAYRQAAELGTALDRDMDVERNGQNKRELMVFWCFTTSMYDNRGRRPFSQSVPVALSRTIQRTKDQGLCALADELFQEYGGDWALPALTAALMTLDTQGAYRRGTEILSYASFNGQKPAVRQGLLRDICWSLYWNKETGQYEYLVYHTDPATANRVNRSRPDRPCLAAPLDIRWYDILMEAGDMDAVLENLLRPEVPEIREKLGPYFYQRAVFGKDQRDLRRCVGVLCACGWTQWEDFLFKSLKNRGELNYYLVMELLRRMPISDRERAVELKKIDQYAHTAEARKGRGSWPSAVIEKQIADWLQA